MLRLSHRETTTLRVEAIGRRWYQRCTLLVLVAFCGMLAALPTQPLPPPRVAQALLALAEQQATTQTEVIVRHTASVAAIGQTIASLGGSVSRELPLVGGVVAQLPAGALPTLGRTPGVSWISPNAAMERQACTDCVNLTQATAAHLQTTFASQLWQQSPESQGQGITVAVVDSGIASHPDLKNAQGVSRITAEVPMQRNLVFNPGFEANLQSWTQLPDGRQIGTVTKDAHAGGAALVLPRSTSGMQQAVGTFSPGTTYRFGSWGKVSAPCGMAWSSQLGIRGGGAGGADWNYAHSFCERQYTLKELRLTIPSYTTWVQVYALNDNPFSELTLDDISLLPVEIESSDQQPLIFGDLSAPTSSTDLSAVGTIDWALWGQSILGTAVRRSGAQSITMRPLWAIPMQTVTPYTFTWSNGASPTAGSSKSALAIGASRGGFELTAPADTTLRTLRIYGGMQSTGITYEGQIDAYLSDGSAPPYVSTIVASTTENRGIVHTISYRASRAGQTLTVRWGSSGASFGQIVLQAATLTTGSPFTITSVATSLDARDQYGHGTHVAGIIAGNGLSSGGKLVGIAPAANLVNVRVNDANGRATAADVIDGLQWIYENRTKYNIRVVNLSLNSAVPESYHTSALSAAVELLWFSGIVVVVSAGNNGDNGVLFPPANDPFVITVGATDDQGTPSRDDDVVASFSARGLTEVNTRKPEIVAPGVNVVSLGCSGCVLNTRYPQNTASGFTGASGYFRASGTSMAAPMVAAAAALILQRDSNLNPDQVKYRLVSTGTYLPFGGTLGPAYLHVQAAVNGTSKETLNTGLLVSGALTTGEESVSDTARWGSARWGSARWGSARWGSVNWNTSGAYSSMRTSMAPMSQRP